MFQASKLAKTLAFTAGFAMNIVSASKGLSQEYTIQDVEHFQCIQGYEIPDPNVEGGFIIPLYRFNNLVFSTPGIVGNWNHLIAKDHAPDTELGKLVRERIAQDDALGQNDLPESHFGLVTKPLALFHPSSDCRSRENGWPLVEQPGEYILGFDKTSLRIVGDVCSQDPTFILPVTVQPESGMLTLESIFRSKIVRGEGLPIGERTAAVLAEKWRAFESRIVDMAGVTMAQCGSLPAGFNVDARIVEGRYRGIETPEQSFQIKISIGTEGFGVSFEEAADAIAQMTNYLDAKRAAAMARFEASRPQPTELEYLMSTPEGRARIGGAIMLGIAFGMFASSPCNDNNESNDPYWCD